MKEKKPENAGTRCLTDCPLEKNCIYSAEKNYLTPPYRWEFYVWESLEGIDADLKKKRESLKTDNPYGKCVWECERDGNVDHQSVMVRFANGSTGTFNMIGGASRAERNIHIIGTQGEIKGTFDDSRFVIRRSDPETPDGYTETIVDLKISGDKTGMKGEHGGGDRLLVEDFVNYVDGEKGSISSTSLEQSVLGHLAVFRAEKARKENRVVSME